MSKSYNIPPQETAPRKFNHLNGSIDEILARFCVSELCLAWPVYRDASEWRNYRESFADDAVVFTSKYVPREQMFAAVLLTLPTI